MKNLQKRITSFADHPFAVPLILLAVTLLAYGLSFWRLGFYWDDQPISWIRYQLGQRRPRVTSPIRAQSGRFSTN